MPRCNVLFQRRTSKLINSFFLNMKTSFFIMWGPYLLNYNPGRIKKNQYPIATLIPQVFAVSLTNNISPNLLYLIKLWVIGQSLHLNQSMYNAPKFNDLDWTNIPYGFTALSYLILKTDGVTHGKICPHPQNKISHCFCCFPIYWPWSDGTRCHDLSFLNISITHRIILK